MAFVYGKIGDGKDVLARLHRADIIRDVFGGANPVHAALQRFKEEGRGVIVILRDGAAGVPTQAIPVRRPELGGRAHQAMARGRARRADPEGSRHFLDPAADLGQAHLCRPRRLRHRNHRHREPTVNSSAFSPPRPPCHHRAGRPQETRMRGRIAVFAIVAAAAIAALAGFGFAAPNKPQTAGAARRSGSACRSMPRWCSRSMSPTRWIPKSRRCSARATWRR